MEADHGNLQNDFFNAARKERSLVSILFENGKELIGRVKSFDKFTLLLEGEHGDQIVFKHAICTVSMAELPARGEHEGEMRGREEAKPIAGRHRS